MKSNLIRLTSGTPEINISTLDFETYLDSLVSEILVATLIFFVFVFCIYLIYLTIHYFIIQFNPLADSNFEKQNLNHELPVENLII